MLRFRQCISVLGRSERTYDSYARHIAQIALHFQCLPTELEPEQVQDYLYGLQQRSKTPSQTYFKHTVYGLRFLLKSLGLPYDYLRLPEIKKSTKLPVVLSKQEVWRMLQCAPLLKHKMLIAVLYGCGLRNAEVRNLRLNQIDFERNALHIVQSKGNKDRIVPLCRELTRGLQKYIDAEQPVTYLFNGSFDQMVSDGATPQYSQRGVQWVVTQTAKRAGIKKEVNVHTLRHTHATHLLEDGMNILQLQQLLGHENIDTTMLYLRLANVAQRNVFSPIETLFAQCSKPQ